MCVCVCVCARARVCMHVRVRACVCVCVHVTAIKLNAMNAGDELGVWWKCMPITLSRWHDQSGGKLLRLLWFSAEANKHINIERWWRKGLYLRLKGMHWEYLGVLWSYRDEWVWGWRWDKTWIGETNGNLAYMVESWVLCDYVSVYAYM